MMPFIGVRISWLMLATKSLLARDAASAASLARCSTISPCLRSVMSRPTAWMASPPSCSGRVVISTVSVLPSGREQLDVEGERAVGAERSRHQIGDVAGA